jgi:hypothetical protein
MDNVAKCLSDWRASERVRDAFADGSPDWAKADEEVRRTRLVYQATVARVEVTLGELEFEAQRGWGPMDHAVARQASHVTDG